MRHVIALLLLIRASSMALGQEQDEQISAVSTDEESGGSEIVQIKVPKALRAHGYRLRLNEQVVDLENDTLAVKDDGNFVVMQLITTDGRVLAGEEVFLQEQVLKDFTPNQFRLGLHIGGTTIETKKFHSLLQDRLASEQSIDLKWLPAATGLIVSLAGINSLEEYDPSVTSDFSELQARLGAMYQFVPFQQAAGFVSWIHLDLTLAAMMTKSWIRLGDGVVDVDDKSNSNGLFAAADLTIPLYNFWLSLRTYASWSQIKFEKLDYETAAVRRGLLIGGMYAL